MGHRATLEGKIRTTEEAGKDGSVLLSCTYTSMTPFSITFSLPPPSPLSLHSSHSPLLSPSLSHPLLLLVG